MKNTQNVNGEKILSLKTSWKNDCKQLQLHVFFNKEGERTKLTKD